MTIQPILPLWLIIAGYVLCAGTLVFCLIKKGFRHSKYFRRIAMVILLITIFLRPGFLLPTSEGAESKLSVFFIADASGSMVGKDVDNGTVRRFEKVQKDIQEIAKGLPGARYSIIASDYAPYTLLPSTNNIDTLATATAGVRPKYTYRANGSDLNSLISYAAKRIREYHEEYPDRLIVVYFFSDGEDTTDEDIKRNDSIANTIIGGAVLGYGSVEGVRLEQIGYYGEIEENYIYNSSYQMHISAIDEARLKAVASQLGVNYYHRESGTISPDVYNTINNKVDDFIKTDISASEDLYWVFALFILVLLLWELSDSLNMILSERKAA